MLLKDRIAIVTGAAQGIGFAIAKMYAQEGATVIIGDVNEAQALQAAATITEETGGETAGFV